MDTVVEITQSLVRIPSVNQDHDPSSAGAQPVFDWLEQWGRIHGFDVERHRISGHLENLTLMLDNRGPRERGWHLLLNGHVDTVTTEGMTIDPFGAELRDGKVWGRGTCDMKGPIASMLVAALRLKEDRDSWQGKLTLGFTPDEEATTDGIRALMNQIAKPDYAIVGEPTSLKPLRGCKGAVRFRLTCKGRAAHSSAPSLGRSAVVAMSRAILALDEYFKEVLGAIERPQFGSSTGSVGVIKGGSAINIVPDHASIEVDVRLVPGQCPKETLEALQTWFAAKLPEADGISWQWDVIITDPAFEIAPDHELTQALCKLTGTDLAGVAHFCCDASKIAAADVPCIILGPGSIEQAHTRDEYITVEQLERGVEVYADLVRTLLPKEA